MCGVKVAIRLGIAIVALSRTHQAGRLLCEMLEKNQRHRTLNDIQGVEQGGVTVIPNDAPLS